MNSHKARVVVSNSDATAVQQHALQVDTQAIKCRTSHELTPSKHAAIDGITLMMAWFSCSKGIVCSYNRK